MKKYLLFFLLCILFGSMSLRAATLQRTILSHNGKLTQYDVNRWQEAIADAVKGDTVFFTPGVFPGDVTVTKAITMIGAGVREDVVFWKDSDLGGSDELAAVYDGYAVEGTSTVITGSVNVSIPGSVLLTTTFMEGIVIRNAWSSGIHVTEPVTGLTIKRCQIARLFDASAKVTNLRFENCYCSRFQAANLENPEIYNCYFQEIIGGGEENIEVYNSVVTKLNGREETILTNWVFTNCIILPGDYTTYAYVKCNAFVNCLYAGDPDDGTSLTNCWNINYPLYPHLFTKTYLDTNGYLDNYERVVGPLGGDIPFTFEPSLPYVLSSTLDYQKVTKKLNVNATVKKGH